MSSLATHNLWRRNGAPAIAACVAGAFLGLTYTLSPMTAWFGLAMAALLTWAGRGLTQRERVWVFGLLSLAIALRLLALIAFFFLTYRVDGSFAGLIPDEPYTARRAVFLRNIALSIPIARADYFEAATPYGESGVHYVFAYLQLQLGAAPYGIRLLNVAFYIACCVTLYRTARRAFGAPAAVGGLAVALFLPTMFIWSISAMKEPAYFLLTAISLAAAVTAARAGSVSKRAIALAACAASVLLAGTMRAGAVFMVGGGIVTGVVLALWMRRPVLFATSLALCTVMGVYAMQSSRLQGQARELFRRAATVHYGHVNTIGWSYKLLGPEMYIRTNADLLVRGMTRADMARFSISAAASFVLVPLPWKLASPSAVAYLPEHVVWYVLVVLAAVGSLAGIRRDPLLTLVLLGIIVLSAAAIGLTSGNVGTLIRHRGMVLMLVPWLSSLGACELVKHVALRWEDRVQSPERQLVGV